MKNVISVDEILENLTFEVIKWNYGASSAECNGERLKSKKLLHSLLISKLPEKPSNDLIQMAIRNGKPQSAARLVGYGVAIDDVKAVLDELFGVGDE